ncbi:MAG: hypothetical protein HY954_08475 [Deltaproteobacteria bacterium]|nr:hypothetical protein [Deltaproteobacteria bacterium]
MKRPMRPETDAGELLQDLIHFMEASASSYDNEFLGEAQRLAICIRAIAEDTGVNLSILSRLGLKELFFYDNSPDYNPDLGLPFSGLAVVTIGGPEHRYTPRLGKNPRIKSSKSTFDEWWNKLEIIDSENGISLSREGIILAVSNTYAPGTDPELNEEFNRIILNSPIGWVNEKAGVSESLMSIEFASARQIAYELLLSLKEQVPEYFAS